MMIQAILETQSPPKSCAQKRAKNKSGLEPAGALPQPTKIATDDPIRNQLI